MKALGSTDKLAHAWTRTAKRTMQQNPNYFVWWYTVKSIGLAGAIAVAAYYAGKSHGLQDARR